jgi:hypothetical protein
MISRKTAKLLSEVYDDLFVVNDSYYYMGNNRNRYEIELDKLYDFLYEEDYAAYFLNSVKAINQRSRDTRPRDLLEFLMKIHTGESLYSVTKEWTWEARAKLGQRYLKDLSESIIRLQETRPGSLRGSVTEKIDKLKASLALDGYIYKDGTLYQVSESVVDEQQEQTYLQLLVDKLSLQDRETIKHHIKLAEEHYINGKWDDSIANSRKFLEAILSQIAAAFNLKKYSVPLNNKTLERPVEVRDHLEREKLIETKEKEAIAKVYGLLSSTGSHPYIAEKDQARLMWHLALTFSQFVLLRFEGYLAANP